LRQYCEDTTIYIFNKLRGEYYYAVYPEDKYENTGNLSNITKVAIENFALPYSNPNPFQTSCDIVLDYPDTLQPIVEIFSISGRRVKKFEAGEIENKTVFWDGKDENNRDVGSGLYYILLKDGSFKKIGKIARQR
ncbi:MAG: T9SS type A sorting domain-containing protein, partial [Thermoplasmatales archaeon]|nr:T9SS type A sorting domain-containing protein [Thermoplasmatales archaeon]